MATARKTIVYIAASVDGYIAGPGEDLGFLSIVEKEGEDYGYAEFIKTVDTVIMGRKTYDWIMEHVPAYVHDDLDSYIITHTKREAIGKVQFYTGDLKELVRRLKQEPGKNIFIEGGAQIIHELLNDALIDEMIISVIPVLVGDGTRLFKDGRPEQKMELVSAKSFDSGLVQMHYTCVEK